MNQTSGEVRLQQLQEQIGLETEALVVLDRRSQTLEIEVAAWPPPQIDLHFRAAALMRSKAEMVLGIELGLFACAVGMIALLVMWGPG